MGAFIYPVTFPISDGVVVAALKAGLTTIWGATGLTVQPEVPEVKTRRMVSVRNDSGPQERRVSRRRYGVNVWADSPVDAQSMALDAMSILTELPTGAVVVATDSFSGPFRVDDDPPLVVGSKNLAHYYFVFRVSVKGNAI